MPRKCSVFNCVTKYKTDIQDKKVSVFKFPKDEKKRQEWINALPNKFEKVTEHMGVCELHWPADARKDRKAGGRIPIPTDPPSVFPDVPPSCIPHVKTPRKTVKATAEARTCQVDQIDEFLQTDTIRRDTLCSSVVDKFNSLPGCVSFPSDHDFYFLSLHRNGPVHKLSVYFKVIDGSNSCSLTYEAFEHLKQITHPRIKVIKFYSELDEVIRFVKNSNVAESNEKVQFLCRAVSLLNKPNNGFIYSVDDLLQAFTWYAMSRSLYEHLRVFIHLPSISTLQRITSMAKNTSDHVLFSSIFKSCEERSRNCILIIDEVYVKASLSYRGGTVHGYAVDYPGKIATTLLCIMVKCFFGSRKFLAKVLPCHALTAKFQFDQVQMIIHLLEQCGGKVVAIVNDNNRVNQAFFKMFQPHCHDKPWIVNSPHNPSQPLFLMYDTVHLLKNIRNNWTTEKEKILHFSPEGSDEILPAQWADLKDLHKHESSTLLKLSDITPASIQPSNIEKQKLSLVLNIFSEKTSSALKSTAASPSWINTSLFIDEVLKLWKVFNTKTLSQSVRLRDPERAPITLTEKRQVEILRRWAFQAMAMKPSTGPRCHCLTKDTASALSWTCQCLIDISEFLLLAESSIRHEFVTLGFFQQDDIEKHFAHFRKAAGCNFYITAQDVAHTDAIDRTKLMLQNEPEIDYAKSYHNCELCQKPLTDSEISVIDDISLKEESLSADEKMALLYIGGYVASRDITLQGHPSYLPDGLRLFTDNLDRGGLKYPSDNFFNLLVNIFVFFKSSKEASCRKRLINVFKDFPSLLHIDVQVSTISLSRVVNILMKRFCIDHQQKSSSEQQRRKIAKLSSSTV